jgi:hypothetical protein
MNSGEQDALVVYAALEVETWNLRQKGDRTSIDGAELPKLTVLPYSAVCYRSASTDTAQSRTVPEPYIT